MSSGSRVARRLFLEPLESRRLLASDFLLEIEGIKGESQVSGHEGAIEIDSFSWGANNPGSATPIDVSRVEDFHFVTKVSKASPLLLKAVATGEHIKKAVLFVRKSGDTGQEYLEIKLTDVLVSSFQRQSLNEELPKEEIALTFSRIDQKYCPTQADGSTGQCTTTSWDVGNVKFEPNNSLLDERTSPNVDETDAFLQITGIKGESTDSKHKDEIEIESFSWGVSQSTHGAGGGGGAGKVSMQDFHFVMKSSKASPMLAKAAATGEHIKQAQLTVRRPVPGSQSDFLTIKLKDILVSSYEAQGTSDTAPLEEVTFTFSSMTESFTSSNPDGSAGTTSKVEIDGKKPKRDNPPGTNILDKTVPPAEANDMFLEIDGIKGESTDAKHKDSIQIESYSWGVSQGAHSGGGGGGAGKVHVHDITFVKTVSKATPLLAKAAATGQHIKKVELSVRKESGEANADYLTLEMQDVLVSSYQIQSLNQSPPSDQFSINFSKVEFEYKPQKPDGSLDAPVKAVWIVPNNAKHSSTGESLFALPDASGAAAHDFFLEIEGIKGESTDEKHHEAIEIESFSWGVNQTSHGAGGGGGAGKVSYQDMHFVTNVGKASPLLLKAVATGEHIKKAILYGRKAGSDTIDYLKITLADVLVSSYQVRGIDNAVPLDEITINFAKMEVDYVSQSEDGKSSTTTASLAFGKKDSADRGPSILAATQAPADTHDYFLEIGGIKGESTDEEHKDAIEIQSYSWGLSQTGSFGTGGGGGAGKVQVQDFHFVMNVSSATPDLLDAMSTGTHLSPASLAVRRKDPRQFDQITYDMEDLIVSSYRTEATARTAPLEEVALNFAKIEQKVLVDPRLSPVSSSWSFSPSSKPLYLPGESILDDTTPDPAAHDIFLEIEGVKGESTDDKFRGSLDIDSFSWGMSRSISSKDRSIGRPKIEDFEFVADFSSASGELLGFLAQGKHISKAVLTVRKSGEKSTDYYQIKLQDILVTSYQTNGQGGGTPSNPFSLSAEQIEFSFVRPQPPGDAGSAGTIDELFFADSDEWLGND